MFFFGRERELNRLTELQTKNTASLVVVRGRRRIGKSTLVQKFSDNFDVFCEIHGIAPKDAGKVANQLDNFSEQLSAIFDLPQIKLENWNQAFAHLASQTRTGKTLILLDEVSWMAHGSKGFAGKLKIAWDTRFKKNSSLILVVCGSASSWIEKNIIRDADFVGRVSLDVNLKELPIKECNKFWESNKAHGSVISAKDKLKILSITGGVPKYLEEVNVRKRPEDTIKALCFEEEGILFQEFENIFNDIFNRRSAMYKKIVTNLASGSLSVKDIANATGLPQNGDLTEYLHDLEVSGFIIRDFVYTPRGRKSRLSKYRIKDNYLRFYLRYIEPVRDKVKQGLFQFNGMGSLPQWPAVMGLQFENMVLHNLQLIIEALGIDYANIISASPYFQGATKKNKGACQIDLLIHTRFGTFYVCEIKFARMLSADVIDQVKLKMDVLQKPKNTSLRPVLIFSGQLSEAVEESHFFDEMINFESFLEQ